MSNRTVQAAAEGMPKPDLGVLESAISDARMSAQVVQYLADHALSDHPGRSAVETTKWERDLVLFVADQAKRAADAAMAAFDAFVAADREAGR